MSGTRSASGVGIGLTIVSYPATGFETILSRSSNEVAPSPVLRWTSCHPPGQDAASGRDFNFPKGAATQQRRI